MLTRCFTCKGEFATYREFVLHRCAWDHAYDLVESSDDPTRYYHDEGGEG